jgi:alkanesulfonate monooxygenase SsuD/methylene tetrahydromethanopterin reductase-like flavin-dependent oxidoreductase (luciferase family)
MIKTWVCEFNRLPNAPTEDYTNPAVVQEAIDALMVRLNGLDDTAFEGVFFAEHHFVKALMPVPNLFLGALGQTTKRLKLGVLGNVLPFHQPWRLAEELHMLDYLTQGRLEIGVASGVPFEFDYVNIAPDDVRPIYAEVLEFIDLALENEYVTYKGKFFDFRGVPVMPRPRPETRKRKWMTLYSKGTAQLAASKGYKICTAYQSVDAIREVNEAYFAKADELGISAGPDDVAVRRQVNICETDSEAQDQHPELLANARRQSAEIFAAAMANMDKADSRRHGVDKGVEQTGIVDAAAPKNKDIRSPLDGMISMEDEYLFGSPATVAERIIDQCRRMRGNHFMAYHSPALGADKLPDLYGKYWPQVHTILAKAGVTREAA